MDDPNALVVGDPHRSGERWERWLHDSDPVGWVVAGHVVVLVLTSERQHPTAIMVLAAVLLVYRWIMKLVIGRDAEGRASDSPTRSLGSLVLVGAIVGFDGGTDSPLFFSMLIVVVWEIIVSPFRRFPTLGVASMLVFVGVVLLVPDINPVSLVRLGVLAAFLLLLGWARGISEHWQRESFNAKALAAEIAEGSPIGFAYYDAETGACRYMNPAGKDLGLTVLDERPLIRPGAVHEETFREARRRVAESGESDPPTTYQVTGDDARAGFVRLGISLRRPPGTRGMVMVHAEDVTHQVSVGEQHRRFLVSANHQFRTPLSPILAYAELIATGELEGADLVNAAGEIAAASRRIERLLDRISVLLRLRSAVDRNSMPVLVSVVVEDFLLAEHPEFEPLLVVESENASVVRCDPRTIATALAELVDNGRLHGTPPVSISICSAETEVRLRIRDRGNGPDLDPSAELGEAWTNLTSPEVNPPGMGERLGIAFAHTLTAMGGGTLGFERSPGDWAFTIDLQAADGST